MDENPEVSFKVEEIAGGVLVAFALNSNDAGGVSEGVSALLGLIGQQPGMRSPAMATVLGTSPKNIERWLKQLKTQSLIEFKGAPKTGGYHSTQHNATNPKEGNKE